VFDPLDPLVEWCAELEAPIGLPGYATNNDSSSDSESAQLLSFLSHREAKNAGLSFDWRGACGGSFRTPVAF
jgi:hypothetical protein